MSAVPPARDRASLRGDLVRLLRPYRTAVAAGCGLVLAWTGAVLAGPALIRFGIDEGIARGDATALALAALLYAGSALVAYGFHRWQLISVNRTGELVLRDLRVRVFAHLQALPMGFHDRQRSGALVSRMTADVDALSEFVQGGLFTLVTSLLLLVFSAVVLLVMAPVLALACLLALAPVAWASRRFRRDAARSYQAVQEQTRQLLAAAQESLTMVRVLQAHGAERAVGAELRAGSQALFEAHRRAGAVSARYFPVIEVAGVLAAVVVLVLGGLLSERDAITVGTVVAFVLYLANVLGPVEELSYVLQLAQSAGAGLHNLSRLLEVRGDLPEPVRPVPLPRRGELRVRNLSFAYRDGPLVLHDVELTVAPGERIGLVGPTGSGKSTLGKLIARLYDPSGGSVCYAGVDLRAAAREALRRRVAVVPQEGFVFQGTVRDNVRLGRPEASDAEVEQAVQRLGAADRLGALPAGLDTRLGARGAGLSAGERQLVSLARVALVDPSVLVLDEVTSNVDLATERVVEDALERLLEGRTVIVIAHRVSTAERADRVIVLDAGRIVDAGPPAELRARGGPYAGIARSWRG